jgi:HupE / UreJ protein
VLRRVVHSAAGYGVALLLLSLLGAVPSSAPAHEVPNDVKVHAFFKPEGRQLHLLVRVPLAAMQEVDFPRRGPGYLDLPHADAALRTAANQWLADKLSVFEDEQRLPYPQLVAARVSLPSDRSFADYASALANINGARLPDALELYWNQALLDVHFEFPIRSAQAAFSIEPRLARLGLQVVTSLLVLPPGGASRAFEFHGNPGLVRLDPRWHHAALRFAQAGLVHILEGRDHLLFILCLVIPLRRWRSLALIVTAFTAAHSVTLIAAALGFVPGALWFAPLVEALIAASIVAMALQNIFGAELRWRWIVTCLFGLVHGFGFSFALRDTLQFAGPHVITALLSFNAGVEAGQLLVLLVLVPLCNLLLSRDGPKQRIAIIVICAFIAHTGWHWMLERGQQLSQFPWPAPDAATWASVMRWAMAALLLAGVLGWLRWRRRGGGAAAARGGSESG